jgi:hypothetical protein
VLKGSKLPRSNQKGTVVIKSIPVRNMYFGCFKGRFKKIPKASRIPVFFLVSKNLKSEIQSRYGISPYSDFVCVQNVEVIHLDTCGITTII